jgi:catechol 2,3-dioxygenase-like lactoylglutathione lyase family enzyme
MSSTELSNDTATGSLEAATIPLRLEVVVVPVSDVDSAASFYKGLGWRVDAEASVGDDYRILQMTPPGSTASIIFGKGVTSARPGSIDSIVLAVDDIEAARDDLRLRGVDVSEVFHDAGGGLGAGFVADPAARAPGRDPEGRSYASYATFSDPDGNTWTLQELTERLPGRVTTDVGVLADLLHETAEHHDAFEKATPPHDWWDWYAAYLDARERGSESAAATAAADRYMADVKGIVASR